MGRRNNKKGTGLKPYQSKTPDKDSYCLISFSMRSSPPWHALKASQRGLYVELAGQYRVGVAAVGTPRHDHPERADFMPETVIYYSQSVAKASGSYTNFKTGAFNNNAFREDMKALQAFGFIDLMENGRNARKPNVYRLSTRWRDYTTEDVQRIMEGLEAVKDVKRQNARDRKRLSDERKRYALPATTRPADNTPPKSLPPADEGHTTTSNNGLTPANMEGFTMADIEREAKSITELYNRRTAGRKREWQETEILLSAVAALQEKKRATKK